MAQISDTQRGAAMEVEEASGVHGVSPLPMGTGREDRFPLLDSLATGSRALSIVSLSTLRLVSPRSISSKHQYCTTGTPNRLDFLVGSMHP
ncbi:hypothetical protein THAOC_19434 [Thalassiosira oceanica]|uniref:Uncharacterized protein n=1 Tax=Thalassiosira oceanica TaxID=159749 RepID=K0SPC0_THAOC|nr:hypothetical protein THAOC_19434 [Thalassiosira oceanica]|eukprot:EJK60247.1 hypothetical protein THAOC_19434 [Thalassiosira oceanica]